MPTTFVSSIQQVGRSSAVGNSTFFYLIDGMDVDFTVEQIVESSDTVASQLPNHKYLINSLSATFIPSLTEQIPTVAIGDIVRWAGSSWELFYDASNAKTQTGIVFDKRTKSLYTYNNSSNRWVQLLSRQGTIDGGTFS